LHRTIVRISACLAVLASALLAGCGEPAGAVTPTAPRVTKSPAECGIEIVGVGLSAGGYMLDFRYRVVDPDRALPVLARKVRARITDQATGAVLLVPSSPKVGALRQSAPTAEAGRVYFVMFANPGAAVKAGARVTVEIGDLRVSDVVVN
jgi:hypothetical protein